MLQNGRLMDVHLLNAVAILSENEIIEADRVRPIHCLISAIILSQTLVKALIQDFAVLCVHCVTINVPWVPWPRPKSIFFTISVARDVLIGRFVFSLC